MGGGVFKRVSDNCPSPGPAGLGKSGRLPQEAKSSHAQVVDIGLRLVLFHHEVATCPPALRPTRADVERLAMLVIGTDEAAAVAHFEKVRAQQHPDSTLLAHFIGPAAQFLSELSKQDVCDFFQVTIGIGRLQAFMDRLAAPEPVSATNVARRALLIALPGEAHLLGFRMVAKSLEWTGWDVTVEEHLPAEDNAKTVVSEWIGVVGVSVSVASRAELAARTIAVVRKASLNPDIAVMAGGSALIENPQLGFQIGADAVSHDAPTAVVLASHLLMRQAAMR
jgi:methylmalonyl-CoA mutase cobalamin-binding domain/chain